MRATETIMQEELPLFPLQAVLFPGGLLNLKVFEVRYVDLVTTCLREQLPFGVVALRSGHEVRRPGDSVSFETVGTLAELVSVDSDRPGILQVSCRGGSRFRVLASNQRADGLWLAHTDPVDEDEVRAPTEAQTATVRGLAEAIATMKAQGVAPFLEPYRFDDAGWVANRWCEILPISQAAKFRLMELPDPIVRLQLVDDYLRSKGVVGTG
jgi:Lon protease-like protein